MISPSDFQKRINDLQIDTDASFSDMRQSLQPKVGELRVVAGMMEPVVEGWLRCDGAAYAKADYTDLFEALGGDAGAYNSTAEEFVVPVAELADSSANVIAAYYIFGGVQA